MHPAPDPLTLFDFSHIFLSQALPCMRADASWELHGPNEVPSRVGRNQGLAAPQVTN